jgi:uncharacterized membrane protein
MISSSTSSSTSYTEAQQFRSAGGSAGLPALMESDSGFAPHAGPASPVNVGRMERYLSTGLGAVMGLAGLSRGRLPGLLLVVGGGSLLYRGLTGHCHLYDALGIDSAEHPDAAAVPAQQGQHVEKAIAINRSPEDLFAFWRDLMNLPQVMPHIKRVEVLDSGRSRWIAEGLFGRDLQWEAEIYNERPNELIAWRSLPGSDIDTAGSVRFKPLGHDRGTEVRLSLKYNPPGGKLGAIIATVSGRGLDQEVTEDLRNIKRRLETGELPTASAAALQESRGGSPCA